MKTNKYIKYNMPKGLVITLWICSALFCAFGFYNIMKVCNIGDMVSFNRTSDILLLILAFLLSGTCGLMTVYPRFIFKSDEMVLHFGLFKVRLSYSAMEEVIKLDKKYYLKYRENDTDQYLALNLAERDLNGFLNCIKEHRYVLYHVLDSEKKDKEKTS